MKVKKKLISSLKNCFILSLCVVIGFSVSLQGFCANTLSYPLILDYAVMSSWSNLNDYMNGTARWDKLSPHSSSNSFDCTYQLAGEYATLLPDIVSDSSYTLSVSYALTIPDKSYNTVNSSSFSSKTYLTVVLQNGTSLKVYPTVNFTRWKEGTGWSVWNTFSIPEGAKSVYSITFGCTFNSSYPSSKFLYMTVYPFELTTVTGTDKIINQFGSNYSQPNTDNQDNYNNAESQLIGGVQSTLNDVNSQWNNLNGNLLQYQGAFMAFNRFFNNLTGIPWVGTVITLSVAIGVFALLLGSAFIYANRKGK